MEKQFSYCEVSEFYKDQNTRVGLQYLCRKCSYESIIRWRKIIEITTLKIKEYISNIEMKMILISNLQLISETDYAKLYCDN